MIRRLIILLLIVGCVFARDVIEANNRFAINWYSQYKSEEGNIFFSPFSISTAMAMVYEGAEGKTAKELNLSLVSPNMIIQGGINCRRVGESYPS